MRWIDTTIRDLIRWIDTTIATRGGCRPQGLYHNSDRSVGSAEQPSLLNPRFEPAMATRGGRRPRFEPSMATRGRRPPQHANSAQSIRQYKLHNYTVFM